MSRSRCSKGACESSFPSSRRLLPSWPSESWRSLRHLSAFRCRSWLSEAFYGLKSIHIPMFCCMKGVDVQATRQVRGLPSLAPSQSRCLPCVAHLRSKADVEAVVIAHLARESTAKGAVSGRAKASKAARAAQSRREEPQEAAALPPDRPRQAEQEAVSQESAQEGVLG